MGRREDQDRYQRKPKGRFAGCRQDAKHRGISHTLSFEDYQLLTHLGFCAYCSDPLPTKGSGIDRCDSQLGYFTANVVPCCKFCNIEKGRMTPVEYTLVWMHREMELHFDKTVRWESQSMLRFRNDQSGWRRGC